MDLNRVLGIADFEVYTRPKLPEIQFVKDRVAYSFTDIRYLKESAVCVFFNILEEVISDGDVTEVTFDVSNIDEYEVRIISDILMGIEYEARKKGRNGFWIKGSFLVIGYHETTEDDGRKTITYDLSSITPKIIHDYARNLKNVQPSDAINIRLDEIVVSIAEG